MPVRTRHPLVARYLKRLDSELFDLPPVRRRDIRAEIHQRIDDALADSRGTDTDVRQVLEEMGPPEHVAVRTRERFGVLPPVGGAKEGLTVLLLLVGGVVVPIVGWIAGVALLWSSDVWTRRDKVIGTFVVPGGFALPFFVGVAAVARPVLPPLVVSMVLVLTAFAAIGAALHLRRRMRRAA